MPVPSNKLLPNIRVLAGSVIVFRLRQFWKAYPAILSMATPKTIVLNVSQPAKAYSPILFTLAGIVMLSSFFLPAL